jgi:hypothetical protein
MTTCDPDKGQVVLSQEDERANRPVSSSGFFAANSVVLERKSRTQVKHGRKQNWKAIDKWGDVSERISEHTARLNNVSKKAL